MYLEQGRKQETREDVNNSGKGWGWLSPLWWWLCRWPFSCFIQYVVKVGPVVVADGLDLEGERERGIRTTPGLNLSSRKEGVPLTEVVAAVGVATS